MIKLMMAPSSAPSDVRKREQEAPLFGVVLGFHPKASPAKSGIS